MWGQEVWYIIAKVSEEPAASIMYSEDGGNRFFRNVDSYLTNYVYNIYYIYKMFQEERSIFW
jgi:hypothetical protein